MDSIIFDLDGTLWDSTEICADAWTRIIQQETNLDLMITSERLKQLFGRTLPEIAQILFPDYTSQQRMDLMDLCCEEEHQALLKKCAPLYPELENTLKELTKKYRLFIVSNCEKGYIEVFLTTSGLSSYFDGHLCPGDTGNAKASNIRQVIQDYHLQSPVYVGDTEGDWNAAKSAGIPFTFASYGFGSVPSSDYTIKSFKELLNIF